jgi:hypothetical protein
VSTADGNIFLFDVLTNPEMLTCDKGLRDLLQAENIVKVRNCFIKNVSSSIFHKKLRNYITTAFWDFIFFLSRTFIDKPIWMKVFMKICMTAKC